MSHMAPLPDYVAGTITLTNGSANFTGTGTGWLAAGFREGDTILGIEDNPGVVYVVESVTDNDSGTLTQPWDGPTGTYTYRMRYLSDGQRVTAQARQLIEMLGNGNLQAVAGLPGTPNTFMMFTGAGSVVEVPRTDLVSGANYDVQVDTLAGRAAYDGSDEGFSVLVANTGDGRAAIYSKLSNAVGDWSAPAYVTGPAITLGVGSVTPVAFGNDPDVTLNPVAGGYEFDFELPENATFQSGTITTLNPGEDATFSLSPIAGGYALNLGVPRGPTGDINGVTPFWQGRITVDSNAAAARTGLEVPGSVAYRVMGGPNALASISGSGWSTVFTADLPITDVPPGAGAGVVYTQFVNESNWYQEYFDLTSGIKWWRHRRNAAPTAWVNYSRPSSVEISAGSAVTERVWAAADVRDAVLAHAPAVPTDVYRRSNILGTVSQSGGTPTGAIIERGSTANGEYVRFADGTQICRGILNNLGPIDLAQGTGGFASNGASSFLPYAASFVGDPPTVSFINGNTSGNLYCVASGLGEGTLTRPPDVQLFRWTSQPSTAFFVRYLAIGRWF